MPDGFEIVVADKDKNRKKGDGMKKKLEKELKKNVSAYISPHKKYASDVEAWLDSVIPDALYDMCEVKELTLSEALDPEDGYLTQSTSSPLISQRHKHPILGEDRAGFLTSFFDCGFNKSVVIHTSRIEPLLELLKGLRDVDESLEMTDFFQKRINILEGRIKNGHERLILDGQSRSDVLTEDLTYTSTNSLIFDKDDVKISYVDESGKTFQFPLNKMSMSVLPDRVKDAILARKIVALEWNGLSLDQMNELFNALNCGDPVPVHCRDMNLAKNPLANIVEDFDYTKTETDPSVHKFSSFADSFYDNKDDGSFWARSSNGLGAYLYAVVLYKYGTPLLLGTIKANDGNGDPHQFRTRMNSQNWKYVKPILPTLDATLGKAQQKELGALLGAIGKVSVHNGTNGDQQKWSIAKHFCCVIAHTMLTNSNHPEYTTFEENEQDYVVGDDFEFVRRFSLWYDDEHKETRYLFVDKARIKSGYKQSHRYDENGVMMPPEVGDILCMLQTKSQLKYGKHGKYVTDMDGLAHLGGQLNSQQKVDRLCAIIGEKFLGANIKDLLSDQVVRTDRRDCPKYRQELYNRQGGKDPIGNHSIDKKTFKTSGRYVVIEYKDHDILTEVGNQVKIGDVFHSVEDLKKHRKLTESLDDFFTV